jgi:hypothetical protein
MANYTGPDDPCGNSGNHVVGGYILQHDCACGYDRAGSNRHPLADHRAHSDKRTVADFYVAGYICSRTDGATLSRPAIVADQRAPVDDGIFPDIRIRTNHHSRVQDASVSNAGTLRYARGWMNEGGKPVAPLADILDEGATQRCRDGADDLALADPKGNFVNPENRQALAFRTRGGRFQAVDKTESLVAAGSFGDIKRFNGKRSIAEKQKPSWFHQSAFPLATVN